MSGKRYGEVEPDTLQRARQGVLASKGIDRRRFLHNEESGW